MPALSRLAALAAAGLGIAVLATAAPVAAQSVADKAVLACTSAAKARAGTAVRVFKVSGQTMPIVELIAPGNVNYTCFTDSTGKVLRLSKDKNTST